MTDKEIREFIECMTWEDCTVRLYGKVYMCLGLTTHEDNKIYIQVYEENSHIHEWVRDLLSYGSDSADDCMKHFLEDKYWDGKSFFEVAPDMEWIDL